jgi:hypothetical protein
MAGAMKNVVIGIVAALGIATAAELLVGCAAFENKPPKQRDDWISSPMKYGNTQWEGLHSPGSDAGVD